MTLEKLAAQQAHAAELHEPLTVPELQELARTQAIQHNIDPDVFLAVAQCESGFNAKIRSQNMLPSGKQENSWGVFQINLDAHDVAWKDAVNPYYNIECAATHWTDPAHDWKICYAKARYN
jgi:hypothetical protein